MDAAEREIIGRLADYLEEAHGEELREDHFGDGPDGCSYCEALEDACTILASDAAVKAGR